MLATLFLLGLTACSQNNHANSIVASADSVNAEQVSQAPYTNLEVKDFVKLIGDTQVQLVDVRTPAEFAEGHIDKARMIDFKAPDFLSKALETLSKDRPVAVYCRSGARSAKAARLLSEHGYTVYNMLGGYKAYQSYMAGEGKK